MRPLFVLFIAVIGVVLAISACGGDKGPQTHTFDLNITERQVSGEATVRVKQGDTVVLRWTTDEPVEVHLHGYDISADVKPGETGGIQVVANATGRFPIEAHYPVKDEEGSHNSHDEEEPDGEEDHIHEETEDVNLMFLEVLPR